MFIHPFCKGVHAPGGPGARSHTPYAHACSGCVEPTWAWACRQSSASLVRLLVIVVIVIVAVVVSAAVVVDDVVVCVHLRNITYAAEPDPFRASSAIDGGASAIVFPYVETVEQVDCFCTNLIHNRPGLWSARANSRLCLSVSCLLSVCLPVSLSVC